MRARPLSIFLLVLSLTVALLCRPAVADDPFPPGFWDPVVQVLDGSDWVLENANRSIRIANATVPGNVWTALLADPLLGYLERDYQWINQEPYWVGEAPQRRPCPRTPSAHASPLLLRRCRCACSQHYSKVFEVNQVLWYDFVSFYYEAVFDGLDAVSRLFINGVEVGQTDNMFRRYTFPAPLLDNSQFNRIDIFLYPLPAYVDAAAAAYPYPIEAINPDLVESNRSFVRAPTSGFGWDFAPAYLGVGVYKSVTLRAFNQAWVQDVIVRQRFAADLSDEEAAEWGMASADVLLNVTAFLRTPPHNSSGVLSVDIAGQYKEMQVAFPATPANDGDFLHTATIVLRVPSPALWWPHTHGSAPLYNLTVTFNGSQTGSEGVHTVHRAVGFRTIRVVRAPTPDSPGLSFQFVVNGVPVFMKGANLTPLDPFHYRVTPANVSALLQSAVDANFNMVRVWGGGVYQSDALYDWADRHGLLVWQEFAFACAIIPRREAFLQSIREEANQQIRRLSSHASMAIMGGNNVHSTAQHTLHQLLPSFHRPSSPYRSASPVLCCVVCRRTRRR